MKLETDYRKNTSIDPLGNVRNGENHDEASLTAVAAVIAAAVLVVVMVMMGLGSAPFPN